MSEEDYKKGFIDGLNAYAWWRDGSQWVGSCGTSLREAIEKVESLYNYSPPLEETELDFKERKDKE